MEISPNDLSRNRVTPPMSTLTDEALARIREENQRRMERHLAKSQPTTKGLFE